MFRSRILNAADGSRDLKSFVHRFEVEFEVIRGRPFRFSFGGSEFRKVVNTREKKDFEIFEELLKKRRFVIYNI